MYFRKGSSCVQCPPHAFTFQVWFALLPDYTHVPVFDVPSYMSMHSGPYWPRLYIVLRARRLKYVWSRLPRFYKRCRNVGDTNQIAERSIITKLLCVSHMTVCPFQMRCYQEKSVSESYELARLRPNQERVISFEINDGFRRWCLKCTGRLEHNRKLMLCRITVKLPTFLRLFR